MAHINILVIDGQGNDEKCWSIQLDAFEWTDLKVNNNKIQKKESCFSWRTKVPITSRPVQFVASANSNIHIVNPSEVMELKGLNKTYCCVINYVTDNDGVKLHGMLYTIPGNAYSAKYGGFHFYQSRMSCRFQLKSDLHLNTPIQNFKFNKSTHIHSLPKKNLRYGPIELNENGGSLIFERHRYSAIKVWVEETSISVGAGINVSLPGGNASKKSHGHTFTYPGIPECTLVVFQCPNGVPGEDDSANVEVNYTSISASATSEDNAEVINLDGTTKNLFIALNDRMGRYGDNSGKLFVYARLIK